MALFRPDQYVTNVCAVDLAALKSAGIRAILLDVDNTIMPQGSPDCPLTIREWVDKLPELGFAVGFVSNNWHATIHERVSIFDYGVTPKAMKPLSRGFRSAAASLGVPITECAVIGDQIFTDILGGNLVGATTVLVSPLSSVDLPHTVVLRRIERLIMGGRVPRSGS